MVLSPCHLSAQSHRASPKWKDHWDLRTFRSEPSPQFRHISFLPGPQASHGSPGLKSSPSDSINFLARLKLCSLGNLHLRRIMPASVTPFLESTRLRCHSMSPIPWYSHTSHYAPCPSLPLQSQCPLCSLIPCIPFILLLIQPFLGSPSTSMAYHLFLQAQCLS